MIEKQTATVFYAPTRGRRFFTKSAAIHAEAVALIIAKYPPESGDEYDPGWHVQHDHPGYETMVRRMERIVKKAGLK